MGLEHRRAKARGKVWERKVAKDFGTKRSGPTGLNDADIVHDVWGVECKALDKLQLRESHLAQAKKNAGDRHWVLVIREKGTGREIAVLDYKQFIAMVKRLEELESNGND